MTTTPGELRDQRHVTPIPIQSAVTLDAPTTKIRIPGSAQSNDCTTKDVAHQRVIVIRATVSCAVGDGAGEAFAADGAAAVEEAGFGHQRGQLLVAHRWVTPECPSAPPQCALLEVWAMQAGWAQVNSGA